jgi:hypothetical protein
MIIRFVEWEATWPQILNLIIIIIIIIFIITLAVYSSVASAYFLSGRLSRATHSPLA